MVFNCVVLNCRSEWYPACDIIFHKFPSDPNKREKWLSIVRLRRPFFEKAKICNLLFKESDYDSTGKILRIGAIPFYKETNVSVEELHAHLNGSLSRATMIELQRYYADSGLVDNTNAFYDEFQVAAGDLRSFTECFQVFRIAHSLTTTPKALEIATYCTLQEFQEDGCCYIELRSTPRDTPHMTKRQYIETLVYTLKKYEVHLTITSRLIISINRHFPVADSEEIANLAIEFHKRYPELIVGIELSGNPTIGAFQDFVPALKKAREAGMKVTLHCGEVSNATEVIEMLTFKPERIGHGTCIHPQYGGTEETWVSLCKSKIPVELCLTSNVNSKSSQDYDSHHFRQYYDAGIPLIICTDDKGVFSTSLSQEYKICAETFSLGQSQLAKLSLNSCQYMFDGNVRNRIRGIILNFIQDNSL